MKCRSMLRLHALNHFPPKQCQPRIYGQSSVGPTHTLQTRSSGSPCYTAIDLMSAMVMPTCCSVKTFSTQRQPGAPHSRHRIVASATQRSDSPQEGKLGRREFFLASLASLATAVACNPAAAETTAAAASPAAEQAASAVTPIYFGNGCFWGRQYDYVSAERLLGRDAEQLTSVVGYAGGRLQSPEGRVCYYYADELSVYEQLGHAEVVQVEVHGAGDAAKEQFRQFAQTYFSQFRKTPFGMMRLDPQDMGPGYRNVIGLPGGTDSPFMGVLREANVNGMKLVAGRGNEYNRGKPVEGDTFNTVYILDSTALPFFRAEQYHQFHNGIGEAFPPEYTQQLKEIATKTGRINPTGCPEYTFN